MISRESSEVILKQEEVERASSASRTEEHAKLDTLQPTYSRAYDRKPQTEELTGMLMPVSRSIIVR